MKKTSKIYIAGHRGLVGSAIWKNLEQKGYQNLLGKRSSELNLLDQHATDDFFATEQPEYVFLAAAKVGGIAANNIYRGEYIYENLTIQNNIIHNAWKYGVKKLLFLGSTCIYPKEAPQPMKEEYLLTSPLEFTNEPYAIAKIAGIKMCESYNMQYGTNFISVMPTNLYGPNDNFDLEKSHVLPALLRKIHIGKCLEENNWGAIKTDLNQRPIEGINGNTNQTGILEVLKKYGIYREAAPGLSKTGKNTNTDHKPREISVKIWGTGTPLREFLWSEDMADACVYLMENTDFKDLVPAEARDFFLPGRIQKATNTPPTPAIEPGFPIRNTHINIGTGKEISIRALAELISEETGFCGRLIFDTSKPDGTMRKLTNVSKLNALGWRHKIEIKEGIQKVYNWYINKSNE